MKYNRKQYVDSYGPTVGDKVRLADTDIWVEVEKDHTVYGDENKFGGGKVLRDGMGQNGTRLRDQGVLDLLITNALVIDYTGIYKADIGVKDGYIVGIGKGGNPDIMDGVDPNMICGVATEVLAGEGKIELIHMFVTRDIEEPTAEPLSFNTEDGSMHTVIDVTKLSTMSNPYNNSYIIDPIDKDNFIVKSIKTSKAGETETEEFRFSRLNGVSVTTDAEGVDTVVKQIAASYDYTVALLKDGTIKAWGGNDYGQLGDGTTEGKLVPTLIPGLSNVKQIEAGTTHTLALLEDGTVKAWGYNGWGYLGDGAFENKLVPTLVPEL